MDADQTIVVQETEYAGAGKQPSAQLSFARSRGIEILRGDSEAEIPGQTVVIPDDPGRIRVRDVDMTKLRRGLVTRAAAMVENEAHDDASSGFWLRKHRCRRPRSPGCCNMKP